MQVAGADVLVGRVLNEDNDFMILEIGKHEDVTFTLNEGTENPDTFYMLIFVKQSDKQSQTLENWVPWN
jgi:hypothetical protein